MHTNEVEVLANGGWDARIVVCRNGRLVNTFVVVTARFVVLVDTMINAATAEKLVNVARPYLAAGRTLLVVNTHADYDHCWGNQLFAGPGAAYPAPIIGSRLSVPLYAEAEARAFLRQVQADEPEIFGDVAFTPPTLLFDERLAIDGGDLTLELFMAPGHTVDHAAIYIPEIDTLLAADGAELPYPQARTVDGLPRMRQSLAEMAALGARTVLYCHAPADAGPRLLQDNIAYFDAVEAACRAALARGVPAEPPAEADVIALVGLPFETAVPQTPAWQAVHPHYRTAGHAAQLRMMLAWLGVELAA